MIFSRYRFFQLVLSLSLAFFIICLAVELTLLFTPLYYFDVRSLDIMKQSGLGYTRIVDNYNYMIQYLLNPMPQPFHLPSLAYSVHGRIHFEDVKRIFTFIDILLIATVLINIAGFWIKIKHRDFYFLKTAAIALALFTVIPLIAFALDFNDSFIIFHKIFFRNNYWIFNAATDPVITILPETFFLHAALLVLGIIILGAAVLVICYRIWSRKVAVK
ncbi:TIGR01906 family membrane protein [Sporolactobacillus shoreae]|uniref:TIGR01906 family membrane protein n=1 Tax=Sporolactobacillus shoreae TaxID=1465501 RepID=A0A4Z0GRI2_9BACL|nr:TIGR01906 family membrane protein [Sporolactobacillus shoreae]TGA99461.1 TIGR01906 family membrane protein [Sporolactobacillus shoreae]